MEVLNVGCEKSNSTGFLKLRSNSNGKDASVFLTAISKKRTNSTAAEAEMVANVKGRRRRRAPTLKNDAVRKSKWKTASWGPEKHYVLIRARKESDKRRSGRVLHQRERI